MIKEECFKKIKKCWKVFLKDDNDYEKYYAAKYFGLTKGEVISSYCKENCCEYINVRCKRFKKSDIYSYPLNNDFITGTKEEIIEKLEYIDRIEKIKSLPDDGKFLIQDSRTYHGNDVVWWAIDGNGYTTNFSNVWILSGKKVKSSSWRETDIIWNYEDVVSNTRTVVDMQDIKNKNKI